MDDDDYDQEKEPSADAEGKGKRKANSPLPEEFLGSATSAKKTRPVIIADEKKPTAPRPAKSNPASASDATSRKKPKTGVDRFADIAAKEEETTQKALDVKKAVAEGRSAGEIARINGQKEIKLNKDRLRAELAAKKMELEYKFKMATLTRFGRQDNPVTFASDNGFAAPNVYQHHGQIPQQHSTTHHQSAPNRFSQQNMATPPITSSAQWGQFGSEVSSPHISDSQTFNSYSSGGSEWGNLDAGGSGLDSALETGQNSAQTEDLNLSGGLSLCNNSEKNSDYYDAWDLDDIYA